MKEDELEEESPGSSYKADGRLHAQERDVAKYWRKGLVRIALYGLENQTGIDSDMPLRLFSYDGAAYRAQLLADGEMKEKTGRAAPRYPVVTLVLYFGHDRHWKTPTTLFECLEIPEGLKPYVNDYKINLFEVAYLSDEQVQMFTSDFKIVADYFVQMRKNKDPRGIRQICVQARLFGSLLAGIKHVHELLQLMAVMTQDSRFETIYSPDLETSMCEVLDRIEQRGEQRGVQRVNQLHSLLLNEKRYGDLERCVRDEAFQKQLMGEYGI